MTTETIYRLAFTILFAALINAGCWCLDCRGNLQSCPGICFYWWLAHNQRQVDP